MPYNLNLALTILMCLIKIVQSTDIPEDYEQCIHDSQMKFISCQTESEEGIPNFNCELLEKVLDNETGCILAFKDCIGPDELRQLAEGYMEAHFLQFTSDIESLKECARVKKYFSEQESNFDSDENRFPDNAECLEIADESYEQCIGSIDTSYLETMPCLVLDNIMDIDYGCMSIYKVCEGSNPGSYRARMYVSSKAEERFQELLEDEEAREMFEDCDRTVQLKYSKKLRDEL